MNPFKKMTCRAFQFVLSGALLFFFLSGQRAAGFTVDFSNPFERIVDGILDFANEQLGPNDVGSAYAALINFAGNPDVSASSYNIDTGERSSARLDVFRASFRIPSWTENSHGWKPFVQGMVPYQTLKYRADLREEGGAELEWEAYGLVFSVGNEFQASERLTLTPAVNLGSVRLVSNAGFRGAAAEDILQPEYAGSVFDWAADGAVIGLTLWMDYKWDFERFDAWLHSGVTYNHVESYRSSSDQISFSSSATTLDVSLETVHASGIQLQGFPLSVVFTGGGTVFLGPGRNALGFNSFADLGAALQADISRMGLPVESVRLGAKVIAGESVTGWNLIFSYEF